MPRQFRQLPGKKLSLFFIRLSITRVYCIKTAERIIEILKPSDRPIILVVRNRGSLRKSDGFTPTGVTNARG